MWILTRENIKIAFDSIKNQLLRTALTMLIIAIGITALVGILNVITALRNTLEGNFSNIGANTFSTSRYDYVERVEGGGTKKKISPEISYKEAGTFKQQPANPFAKVSISTNAVSSAEVKYENKKTDSLARVAGVDEHYIDNSGLTIEERRGFSDFDIQNNLNLYAIGSDFKKTLLKDVNPTGRTISVRGYKFKVIDTLRSQSSSFGNYEDFQVLIPLGIARSALSTTMPSFIINVGVDNKDKSDAAVDDVVVLMRNIRGLTPIQESNFGIGRSDDLLQRIGGITGVLTATGFIIGTTTILGSSIALLNIILVLVTKHTKEISIRKALGTKRRSMTLQFFTETLVIAQLGALTGIVLGISLGFLISKAVKFEFTIPWGVTLVVIPITAVVSVLSGFYPAAKASELGPVEALRYE